MFKVGDKVTLKNMEEILEGVEYNINEEYLEFIYEDRFGDTHTHNFLYTKEMEEELEGVQLTVSKVIPFKGWVEIEVEELGKKDYGLLAPMLKKVIA